jgi:hypothetical protein
MMKILDEGKGGLIGQAALASLSGYCPLLDLGGGRLSDEPGRTIVISHRNGAREVVPDRWLITIVRPDQRV